MWSFEILIITTLGFSYSAATDDLGKCCGFGEILREFQNSSFECTEDVTKRRNVYVQELNIIKNNTKGKCLEFSTNFHEFHFSDNKITRKLNLKTDRYFPKCCPLGYVYNLKNHSCEIKRNNLHDFIDKKFVEIGLPRCHLIVDIPLSSLDVPKPDDDYCLDETSHSSYVIRQCTEDVTVCDEIRCVKKCCPDGRSFVNGPYCQDTYTKGVDLSFSKNIEDPEDPFALVYNNTRCKGIFYLLNEKRLQFNLFKDGQFRNWFNLTQSYLIEYPSEDKEGYCIEHSNRTTAKGFFFFHCLSGEKMPLKFLITKYLKILSCIFLALTIFIYILLGQTRKIFGKILINYSIGMFLMFALLIYAQFGVKFGQLECQLVGFGIIFVSTVSFAWLNVMCCDIWLTFGSTKKSVGVYQRRKDLKRILAYSAYGWGMPLLLTLLTYILSIIESLSSTIRPYVGINACFIEHREGNYAQLIFLRVPHLFIQIVNGILFIKTILYCLKIKNEIQRLNYNKNERKVKFNKDKEKLILIVKLSIIMGVTFIFDAATAFVNFMALGTFWKNFEIVVDSINCLQGVFIFLIFICKKTIYNDFLKKLRVNNTTIVESNSFSTRLSLKPSSDKSIN